MRQFKSYTHNEVNLLQYAADQKVKHGKSLTLFVGTDSITDGGQIHYFTVVAFRHSKSGVHFIYKKTKLPTYRTNNKPDIFNRLMKETELTMDTCKYLVESSLFTCNDIVFEMDFNNVVQTISTKALSASKGWAIGEGYEVLSKFGETVIVNNQLVDDQIAVKAANHLCKGIKT